MLRTIKVGAFMTKNTDIGLWSNVSILDILPSPLFNGCNDRVNREK